MNSLVKSLEAQQNMVLLVKFHLAFFLINKKILADLLNNCIRKKYLQKKLFVKVHKNVFDGSGFVFSLLFYFVLVLVQACYILECFEKHLLT